jgi:hypothetical protein
MDIPHRRRDEVCRAGEVVTLPCPSCGFDPNSIRVNSETVVDVVQVWFEAYPEIKIPVIVIREKGTAPPKEIEKVTGN